MLLNGNRVYWMITKVSLECFVLPSAVPLNSLFSASPYNHWA
jgi:hypothetical protein